MRGLLVICAALSALILFLPEGAFASVGVGPPLAPVQSLSTVPPGFSSNAGQAIAAAKSSPALQRLHAREHPLIVSSYVYAGREWYVDFSYHGRLDGEARVSASGRLQSAWTGPLARAVYARGNFAPMFSSLWVLVPFSLAFLLVFIDVRRLRRLVHVDAAAVLSLFVSYAFFEHAQLEAAVWLVYPPLLYLLWRALARGLRTRGAPDEVQPAPLIGTRLLVGGLLLLVAARVGLSLANKQVIDVGYASVLGAHRFTHGQALYWAAAQHADTYGPIAYLAYAPFELLFPWKGHWDYLPSAHIASIFFDLVTVGALVALGPRLRAGEGGKRLGLALGFAWAACPFTLLALMMHSNDGLIAMLGALSLLVLSSPPARGIVLGLAAAAKFSPAALLPLFAAWRARSLKAPAACVGAFAAVLAVAFIPFIPSGGIREFYDHTIGYQLSRADVFSPWALHPALGPLKTALALVCLLVVVFSAVAGARAGFRECAALAAAVMVAVQLPAVHWFYYYVVWFLPFFLVAVLAPAAPRTGHADADGLVTEKDTQDREELALAIA